LQQFESVASTMKWMWVIVAKMNSPQNFWGNIFVPELRACCHHLHCVALKFFSELEKNELKDKTVASPMTLYPFFSTPVGWFYFLLHVTITIINCNSSTSDVGGCLLPRLSE
jgi:hypothetical protein